MADYRVEYWTSSDGTAIASGRVGSGYPVLRIPAVTGQIEHFLWETVPSGFETITFDRRGTGLSAASPIGTTSETYLNDIQAVIDGMPLDRFALTGSLFGVPEVVAIAARNADRVSYLVLETPIVSVRDWAELPRMKAVLSAMEDDWEWPTNAWLREAVGWDDSAGVRNAERVREAWSAEQIRGLVDGFSDLNVEGDLPNVRAPSLVVHRQGYFFPGTYVQQIVACILNCEMTPHPLDPSGTSPQFASDELAFAFLADARVAPDDTAEPAGAFQTILFTDLESSTALTQRVGDEAAQEVLRWHNNAVRGALEANDGREVKHTGDGIMASFPSAVSAVEASLAVQRELEGGEVRVRIGINAGEPIAEDDELFGTAVQLAARITDHAEPGQVLVPRVVMDLCAGKQFAFTSDGEATMKGFDEPIALYAVTG